MIISAFNASLSLQYSLSYSLMEIASQEELLEAVDQGEPLEDADEAPLEPVPAGDEGKQKLRGENGVLRLLQEGHFKGNAEMRLREIFHRELSILGAETTSDTASVPSAQEVISSPDAVD